MPDSMADALDVMMRLQEKDLELRALLASRISIPKAMKENDRLLEREKEAVAGLEEELAALAKRRRSCEKDLEALEQKTKAKERQLLKVANNKEYQALLAEINNAKALQSNSEGDLLKMMEQEEALAAELRAARMKLEPRTDEIERRKDELRAELGRNEALIPAVESERERIAGLLGHDMRIRYERIANGKGGLVIVPVKKGACGGCFTALPAQRINEIKRNDRIITCESCGRLLIWNHQSVGGGGSS